MSLFRPHVVARGPAPPGGPMAPGGAATGCMFGHAGCKGGASCPGGAGVRRRRRPGGQTGDDSPTSAARSSSSTPTACRSAGRPAGANGERVYLPAQLTVPARYNFMQGYIYRLKLTEHPRPAGRLALSDHRGRPLDPGDRRLSDP